MKMKPCSKAVTAALSAVAMLLAVPAARADLIDFESGFVDLQAVGTVATATNAVTFSVGVGSGSGTGFIASVGGAITAFNSTSGADTPEDGTATSGRFFLTDETAGPSATLNYFLTFA